MTCRDEVQVDGIWTSRRVNQTVTIIITGGLLIIDANADARCIDFMFFHHLISSIIASLAYSTST